MIWALHGAVGQPSDWQAIAHRLAEHGQTLRAVDLHRYLECCPSSLEEFARAFCEEVRAVDPEPVLVGYSMGGRLALHALLHDPELFRAAVIISAHPGLTDDREKLLRQAADAEWAAAALSGKWAEFLQRWNAQPVLAGVQPDDRSKLEMRRQAVTRSFMDWSLGRQEDLRGRIGELECQIKWLTGESDKKFTALARGLDGPDHVVVAKAGHRIPWEAPGAVVEAIIDAQRTLQNGTDVLE